MSMYAVDYANQSSGLYDIFGVNGVNGVDAVSGNRSGSNAQKTSTSSGDTVSISAEARELFARKTQMLQMQNDQTEQAANLGAGNTSSTTSEKKASVDSGLSDADREAAGVGGSAEGGEGSASGAGSVAASEGSSGGGGGGADSGSSEDEDRQEELESQLQSLQSQLLGILSGGGDMDVNEMKAAPIQGQIRSVEAELAAMKSQKAKG